MLQPRTSTPPHRSQIRTDTIECKYFRTQPSSPFGISNCAVRVVCCLVMIDIRYTSIFVYIYISLGILANGIDTNDRSDW